MPTSDVYGQGLGLNSSLAQMYPQRQPSESELSFFQQQPQVAGYAAEDRNVVMNPMFQGSQESVLTNERFRQLFRDRPEMIPFDLSALPHQVPSEQYANDKTNLASTIIARLLSGDPSAAPYTWHQQETAMKILDMLRNMYAH
jgi:hypothetical protein